MFICRTKNIHKSRFNSILREKWLKKLDRGELVLSVRIRTNEEKKVHKCKRKQVRLNNIKEDQALNKDVHYQGIAKLAFECTCEENTSKVTSN